jgi:RpiR family transcriptional regulator, carbohydrate utilization regulator
MSDRPSIQHTRRSHGWLTTKLSFIRILHTENSVKTLLTKESFAMNRAALLSDSSILLPIRGLLPSLNEQEQKVGQYVLDHPAEVVHLAIGDLAQLCAASDATIFRFCRKVGADGYGDFKIRLAQEMASARAATYDAVQIGDTLADAVHKVIAADMKALADTLRVLDLVALARAAEVLFAARRVDIYGSGGAAVAALELQYKLMRVGVRSMAHTDGEMQIMSATLLTAEDVAVAFSHSGRSVDVLSALQAAKERGARTIAITNHPASPIAQAVEIGLCTAAQEALAHGYPLGARVAQLALIDALYTCMALARPEETEASQIRIAEVLFKRQG